MILPPVCSLVPDKSSPKLIVSAGFSGLGMGTVALIAPVSEVISILPPFPAREPLIIPSKLMSPSADKVTSPPFPVLPVARMPIILSLSKRV